MDCRRLPDAGKDGRGRPSYVTLLSSLADLPSLETLHLNATPITDAGLKHLAPSQTHKSLNLTDCQLSDAAMDESQEPLPWCRITK